MTVRGHSTNRQGLSPYIRFSWYFATGAITNRDSVQACSRTTAGRGVELAGKVSPRLCLKSAFPPSHRNDNSAMLRRVLIAFISLTVLLYFAVVSTPVALGQSVSAILPALAADVPANTDICSENHWILSVRHCKDQCSACAAECCFGFARSDWCGNAQTSSESAFRNWIQPGVPICIYVHGSFVPADTVVSDSVSTFRWLRQAAPERPVQLICFTWHSDGIFTLNPAVAVSSAVPGLDVAILGKRAEVNGIRLARLLLSLPAESPVCIIGHSHGGRILASALHLLGGGSSCGIQLCQTPCQRRIRAVFAAAAIDHHWLNPGERFGRAMCGADCVLNMKSRNDWALAVYPLRKPFSPRALGQAGFTRKDTARLGDAACRIAEVDVTGSIGAGHIWPRYTERPDFARMLLPWLYSLSFEQP